jgi:hypothetical protein
MLYMSKRFVFASFGSLVHR